MYQFTIKNKPINKFISVLVMLVMTGSLMAQSSIKILDEKTHLPIIGVTYNYGTQMGVSDEMGVMSFEYKEGESLTLSHLLYGEWTLADSQVKKSMDLGVLYRAEQINNIQPVIVMALRGKNGVSEGMDVDNIAKLNHDAGAILSSNAAISVIKKSGGYGFDPVLRGFKYDRLNVVVNGSQCASAACPNRMDPPTSQVSANMMEHIEIMKGPHALRYGASFGGTINFKKAKMKFSNRHTPFGRLSSNYESNGGIYRGEGMIGMSGKVFEAKLFGSWSQGDDYTDGEGMAIPAGFNRGSVGADIGFKLSQKQVLSLSATRNFARNVTFASLPMDLRSDDTWMFNVDHHVYFNNKVLSAWNTTIYGTLVDHVMDNLRKDLDPRKVNATTAAHTHNYGGRTEGTWQWDRNKFFGGLDYRLETAEGNRVRDMLLGPAAGKTFKDNAWQNSAISKAAVFGEFQMPTDFMNFVFSARVEMNRASIKESATEFVDVTPETGITQINPSLSIGGSRLMENGFVTGLWLGRAQRSGGITERYINFFSVGLDPYELVGNPQLDPEVNNQADFTIGYRGKKSVIDVNLFASYLQDYISAEIREDLTPRLPGSPGVRQFVNIKAARLLGFEIEWSQVLFKGIQHKLSVAYTNGEDLVAEQPLPEIAPMDLNYALIGNFLDDKLEAEASFRYVWAQDRISTSFKEVATPAFSLVDIKAGYQFGKYFKLSTGVQNLLDVAYYEHLSRAIKGTDNRPLYAPGRNVFVALTVNFE